MVDTIVATEAREGIVVTREQAEVAYDKVRDERAESGSCPGPDPS
jgi:hypothetical protein